MYAKYFKRVLDFILSLVALIVLSPILLILLLIGAVAMRGNPIFVQLRPGKIGKDGREKIFRLLKLRTMSNARDKDGNLLPDAVRLNAYGRFLRSTSADELPSLLNILKGDLAIVGPRPLAVQYLPFYNETERKRHTVRPGLTGLAQVNGRNALNWPERFRYDVEYVNNISFKMDLLIACKTVQNVLGRKDIAVRGTTEIVDFDVYRKAELEQNTITERVLSSNEQLAKK